MQYVDGLRASGRACHIAGDLLKRHLVLDHPARNGLAGASIVLK
jgi:hypothetical protein